MSAAARLWRGAWLALALLAAQGAQAQGYISRKLSAPVPGGVAVVDLGQAAQAPEVTYRGRPVMVLREADGPWIAVVGIPLAARPGSEAISVRGSGGAVRSIAFDIGAKKYTAQHIKLKNQRQVTPNPDDLKRIERELAEQTDAYRIFRAGVTPSNVLLDRPVPGRLSSLPICGAFSTARSATRIPGWISPPPRARRSRRRRPGASCWWAITSSTAGRCSSTTGRASSACSATCRRST